MHYHFLEAIIDTGTGITVIFPELCEKLNLSYHRKWEGPLLLMANGAVVQLKGSVTIIINKVLVYVEAAIMAMNGYELLPKNNALW